MISPKRFSRRKIFDDSLFSFTKSLVSSHLQNRRFSLIIEIGGIASFKIGGFVLLTQASYKPVQNTVVLQNIATPPAKNLYSNVKTSKTKVSEKRKITEYFIPFFCNRGFFWEISTKII